MAARARAEAARRAIAVAAVTSFGLFFLVVRGSHPAATNDPSGLAAPASLVAEIQRSPLGGGSIAPASGAAAVATSTS
jgi:hypothetical protein